MGSAPTVVVLPSDSGRMAGGGTVSYEVHLDGRWIGWVYDQRPWRGYRFGARRWDATWREDGDRNARATRTGHVTRSGAVDTLVELATRTAS